MWFLSTCRKLRRVDVATCFEVLIWICANKLDPRHCASTSVMTLGLFLVMSHFVPPWEMTLFTSKPCCMLVNEIAQNCCTFRAVFWMRENKLYLPPSLSVRFFFLHCHAQQVTCIAWNLGAVCIGKRDLCSARSQPSDTYILWLFAFFNFRGASSGCVWQHSGADQ